MVDAQSHKVLVIASEDALADLLARALTHPQLQIEAVRDDASFNQALNGSRVALSIAGPLGRRGALVLCEIIRSRQKEAPVLLLHGAESDPELLRDHRGRHLRDVEYLDVAQYEKPRSRGQAIRELALLILGIEEDEESAAQWLAGQDEIEAQAQRPQEPDAQTTQPASEAVVAEVLDADLTPLDQELSPVDGEAAATTGPVTREDFDFADHMVRRMRRVDFRLAPPRAAVPAGSDRTTALLRERVRELERGLARLAFVYAEAQRMQEESAARSAARLAEGDERLGALQKEAEARLAAVHAEGVERTAAVQAANAEQLAAMQERLNAASEAASYLQEELRQKEDGFAASLTQAQDAYEVLRQQATELHANHENAMATYEQRLRQSEGDLALARQETEALQQQWTARVERIKEDVLGMRRTATEQAQQLVDREREIAELRVRLDAREEELAHLNEAHHQALAAMQSAPDSGLAARLAALEESTQATQASVAVLPDRMAASEGVLREARDQIAAIEASQSSFLDALRQQGGAPAQLEARLAAIEELAQSMLVQLAATPQEVSAPLTVELEEQRSKIHALGEVLRESAARERPMNEQLFEARLVALEEVARLAADGIGRVATQVSGIAHQASQDGVAAGKVMELLARVEARLEAEVAAPALAAAPPVVRAPEAPSSGLHRQLPLWLPVGAALLGVLLGVGVGTLLRPSPVVAEVADQGGAAATKEEPAAAADQEGTAPAVVGTAKAEPPELVADAGKAAAPEPAPAAAQAPAAEAAPKNGAEAVAERKVLRRDMFEAAKKKRWSDAVQLGTKLRDGYSLDWESELLLAESLRNLKRRDDAITTYQGFLAHYPDNKNADEVLFALGGLLVEAKRNPEAAAAFEKVAKDSSSKLRTRARQALDALGK